MNDNRFWILFAVMSASILQTIDGTIINVALPKMSGELGATPDSISWVATAYLVAAAVFMPLTGFLNDRLGRKRLLLISIGGFVISSGLCGISTTLSEMVVFRLLQGIFGGMLLPVSQAIVVDTFEGDERVRALSVFTMGLLVAPMLGPTLGGFFTDVLSWRWNFYINLPVGLLSLALATRYVPDTPTKQRDMDWIGFVALAAAIAGLQLVLDKGAEKDWFDSPMICITAAIALVAFIAFLWKSLAGRGQPIFDLRVLKDRNLAMCCLFMLCSGFIIFGTALLVPLFVQRQLGVPAMDTAIHIIPRAISTTIVMGLVGRYAHHFDPRTLIVAGVVSYFISSVLLTTATPQASIGIILLPNILGGMGTGLMFVPLTALAYANIPRHLTSEASGIFNLMRSIGIAFGVSLAVTSMNYFTKVHWDGMRSMVTPYNQNVYSFLQHAGLLVDQSGLYLNSLGLELMGNLVQQQAMLKGFASTLWLIAASVMALLPLLLFLKPAQEATNEPAPVKAE